MMTIEQFSDKIEIQELLSRYARAVDTNDWELWRSVFTDDAVIDYTPLGGIAGTREEVGEYMSATMPLLPMKQHYITNIESTITGDTAEVLAMFYNPMRLPGAEDFSYCGGWYRHQLVRTDTGWRSMALHEENTWFANPVVSESV